MTLLKRTLLGAGVEYVRGYNRGSNTLSFVQDATTVSYRVKEFGVMNATSVSRCCRRSSCGMWPKLPIVRP